VPTNRRVSVGRFTLTIFVAVSFFTVWSAIAETKSDNRPNKELAAALKHIKKSVDKVEKVTWYQDRGSIELSPDAAFKKYADSIRSAPGILSRRGKTEALLRYSSPFYIYAGQSTGNPWLRRVITYAGDGWIFVKNIKIVVDGKSYEIATGYDEIKRKAEDGCVRETLDVKVSASEIALMKEIAISKEAIIRFYGNDGTEDKKISKAEKNGISHVLDLYKALGGEFE